MVAMGTVPVLQEAGRAVSCFEEGSRAVFRQSARPERGRKPRAGLPLLMGVWWSHTHAQPARRGRCGNAASGKKPNRPAEGKKMAGRKRVVTSSTDLGSHPVVIKTPSWPCPAPDSPPPELSPSLGSHRSAGQWPLRPCLSPSPECTPYLAHQTLRPNWAIGPRLGSYLQPLPVLPCPAPFCLYDSFRVQSKAVLLLDVFVFLHALSPHTRGSRTFLNSGLISLGAPIPVFLGHLTSRLAPLTTLLLWLPALLPYGSDCVIPSPGNTLWLPITYRGESPNSLALHWRAFPHHHLSPLLHHPVAMTMPYLAPTLPSSSIPTGCSLTWNGNPIFPPGK